MTIDKAIEILSKPPSYENQYLSPDYLKALGLGIEALKLTKEGRTKSGGMFFHDLPGETSE